jgi:hypothetical protein
VDVLTEARLRVAELHAATAACDEVRLLEGSVLIDPTQTNGTVVAAGRRIAAALERYLSAVDAIDDLFETVIASPGLIAAMEETGLIPGLDLTDKMSSTLAHIRVRAVEERDALAKLTETLARMPTDGRSLRGLEN